MRRHDCELAAGMLALTTKGCVVQALCTTYPLACADTYCGSAKPAVMYRLSGSLHKAALYCCSLGAM